MDILADLEPLNKLHRDAVERARQTNLDSDWNDAQSLERTIKDFQDTSRKFADIGKRMGALEAFAKTVIQFHPTIQAVELFRQGWPDMYDSLTRLG